MGVLIKSQRAKKEPRKMAIPRLMAVRSGLLLANGEVWNGVERRCDHLLTGRCVDRTEESVNTPPCFFG